ncbi:low molecular weight phosphatase family protein [Curtobacterium sp. RRHDQ10]|uniref:arsenate reductase/protein-tyrosine-phosphatase family protein n=1 Tax=Curtobacterium phyllosphaerae TaxID=3413379 RepID=UPI003BF3AC84
MPSDRFAVLVVCTGNLCRSVVAEAYLRRALADSPWVDVASAGTATRDGLEAPPETAAQLAVLGLVQDHRSTAVRAAHVAGADLVLTMTREQRRAVVRLDPRSAKRTFTLREFGRVLSMPDAPTASRSAHPTTALRQFVDEATRVRGLAPRPATPEDDDVVDPHGRPAPVFAEAVRAMRPALDLVAASLRRG